MGANKANEGGENMSVLKAKRSESKAEYINTADIIYVQTIGFLSRLSARYSRLVASNIAKLASEMLSHCEMANNIFPSDEERKKQRKYHLLEARALLMALDVHLGHCYQIMMTNPSGCFMTSSGNKVDSSSAKRKLDYMAQNIGELIDKENSLLNKVLKSDRSR